MDLTPDPHILRQRLRALTSGSSRDAWAAFLEEYSAIILQTVSLFESDADAVADCFLFVCEQLSRNRFHRLRKFDIDGPASFATWLRLVVRRLCVDRHRQEFGRLRIFESVARLSEIDQAVFREVFRRGTSPDCAIWALRARYPHLTPTELDESCGRIRRSLSSRQLWLISAGRPKLLSLDWIQADDNPGAWRPLIPDPGPDPEAAAAQRELLNALGRALRSLSSNERLLVRLRYEQELTLEQVARFTGLPDAQTADRRLKQVLARLRKEIGKTQPASV